MGQDAQRTADAERELGAVQKRIRALGEEITETRGKQDAVLGELNKVEQRIAVTQTKLRRLADARDAQQKQVDATRVEREKAAAALKAQQALLGKQMRAAFLMGDRAHTRMLMQQDDAQRVSRLMTYFERLNLARSEQIAVIDAQTRSLHELEARYLDEQQRLDQLSIEQRQVLDGLEVTRESRNQVITQLESQIRDRGTALKQLERDERDLQALLESLRDLLSDIPLNLGNDQPLCATARPPAAAGQGARAGRLRAEQGRHPDQVERPVDCRTGRHRHSRRGARPGRLCRLVEPLWPDGDS